MDFQAMEAKLSTISPCEVQTALETLGDDDVVHFLDSKFATVGDVAASVLNLRKRTGVVVDAIVDSQITTKLGRIRATYILHCWGKEVPRVENAYLHLLSDKCADVIDCALFGLVFLQDKRNLDKIMSARDKLTTTSPASELFDKAIVALVAQDPFKYSPNYHDSNDVWKLGCPVPIQRGK